ncbi:hypothetical protein BH24CHL5_BH24CHL5_10010 [soil metagenome]
MPLVGLRKLHVGLRGRNDRTTRTARWLNTATRFAFLLAIAAFVAACASSGVAVPGDQPPGFFPNEPASEQGQLIYDFYPVVFYIAVGVFLLVEGLLLWIVMRYRRRPTDTELPVQTHGNNLLEVVWTLIPAAIVTVLFLFTVDTLGKVETTGDSNTQPALTVDVTGFQWQWTFAYEEQGLSFTGSGREGPVMVLPVGERVRIRLHATDVIHSFYVPQFLYKKDVVPGRVNEFEVVVQEAGTYTGQCAEFCGLAHADMFFTVQSMSRADFDAWVIQQQDEAQRTPEPAPSGAATVQVTSVGIVEGFDPTELSVAADVPWVVELTNTDTLAPHDFAVRGAQADGSDWQGDPDASPGGSATYQPPPLTAGEYEFYCSIHPNMVGTLQVGQ